MRALLDTPVLIGAEKPAELEAAISAASLAELHFGVGVAQDPDERARRGLRLGVIESTFEPLPIDAAVAREWGRLAAAWDSQVRPWAPRRSDAPDPRKGGGRPPAIQTRGARPRRRAMDLAIAA